MKKLFNAIRNNDLDQVKKLIAQKPDLVNCMAKQPKKDAGQSPLQVALKRGNFDIASYLIKEGADVNFMEDVSCGNPWRTPVIHDAINAAVMSCRFCANDSITGARVCSTKERADEALRILKKMVDSGADMTALDSYGNSVLNRFTLQARQILPQYNYAQQREMDDYIFTDEVHEDLRNVLQVLKDAGADIDYVAPNIQQTVRDFYGQEAVGKLLREVFG